MRPLHDDLDRKALREAAAWHTRLHGDSHPDDRQAWQQWHAAHPAHQRAWQRVEAVSAQFARIPPSLGRQALGSPPVKPPTRRAVLRNSGAVLGAASAAWVGWHALSWREWQASERTERGQRRELQLPDGSSLTLDTSTAVDVAFDARARLLHLHVGRILVATQPDVQGRPFSVRTPQGDVLALGTRFTVQSDHGSTRVAVQEKAVRVQPTHGAPLDLRAGEQTSFSAQAATAPEPAELSAASWRNGGLVALDMPLSRWADELARYRPGLLQCAPEIAGLRISGAYPLDDTDRALAALAAGFPVQIRYRTRYWVRIESA